MKEKKHYPKVLIIGQSFHLNNGGGITLTNLFKDWPLDRIAVATESVDASGFDYCANYYKFGYLEMRRPWPFNRFQSKAKYGIIKERPKRVKSDMRITSIVEPGSYSESKTFFLNLRHYIGIYPFIYRLRVSRNFLDWLNEFQPDIIYTQLSNFKILGLILQLTKLRKLPIAIHIMDDWPKTLKEPGILFLFWKWYLDHNLRNLFNYSKVLMSICPAMSEEYLVRYNKSFIPFQNTIDIKRFKAYHKKDWIIEGEFTILYAGRIGRGTFSSVLKIAKAVETLGESGLSILFKIRTSQLSTHYESIIKSYEYTLLDEFLPHEQITKELSAVDSLIIPLDFTDVQFTRLSMPTKVPEFLASGTPIIVFAPDSTALYKYANSLGWGLTVSEDSIESLRNAIKLLYSDLNLRKKLGKVARNIAVQNHDGEKVRNKLRETLSQAISKNNHLYDFELS